MFILTKVLLLLIAVYLIVNVLMILILQLHIFDSNNATASSSLYIFTKIFSSHLMNTAETRFIPLSYLDTIDQYRSRVPGLTYNLSDAGYITTPNAPHQEEKEEEREEEKEKEKEDEEDEKKVEQEGNRRRRRRTGGS